MVSTIIRKQVLITACNNDIVYTNIFWHPRVTPVLREIFFITTLYKIFGTCLFVQSLWSTELVDGRGNLQSLHQHCSLTLESDVFGPSYKATQVTLRLNILTYNTIKYLMLERKYAEFLMLHKVLILAIWVWNGGLNSK